MHFTNKIASNLSEISIQTNKCHKNNVMKINNENKKETF
jgi:hypothetical protein